MSFSGALSAWGQSGGLGKQKRGFEFQPLRALDLADLEGGGRDACKLAPALCSLVPLDGDSGANGVICSQIGNEVWFLSGLLKACVDFLLEVCKLQPRSRARCPAAPRGAGRSVETLVFPADSPPPCFGEDCVALGR